MAVARATGVVMALAAEAGVPVEEYGSLEVKNADHRLGRGRQGADPHGARPRARPRRRPDPARRRRRGRDRGDAPGALAVRRRGRSRGGPMISFLEGEIVEKAGARVVVDVSGVGYDVLVPTSTLASLPPAGRRAPVHTRHDRARRRDAALRLRVDRRTRAVRPADRSDRRGAQGRAGVPVLADARRAPAVGRGRRRGGVDRGAGRRQEGRATRGPGSPRPHGRRGRPDRRGAAGGCARGALGARAHAPGGERRRERLGGRRPSGRRAAERGACSGWADDGRATD